MTKPNVLANQKKQVVLVIASERSDAMNSLLTLANNGCEVIAINRINAIQGNIAVCFQYEPDVIGYVKLVDVDLSTVQAAIIDLSIANAGSLSKHLIEQGIKTCATSSDNQQIADFENGKYSHQYGFSILADFGIERNISSVFAALGLVRPQSLQELALEVLRDNGGSMHADDLVMKLSALRPNLREAQIRAGFFPLMSTKQIDLSNDRVFSLLQKASVSG